MSPPSHARQLAPGYVYWSCELRTLALLLAFRTLSGSRRLYGFRARCVPPTRPRAWRPGCSASCSWAPAPKPAWCRCMPGCRSLIRRAEPRLRADERRDDQVRGLRLPCASCSTCSVSRPVVERGRAHPRRHHLRDGVLYALMQHDLKRLLAYHTVENIGIIFIGLGSPSRSGARHGLGGGARPHRRPAARVHHSVFKSLLFSAQEPCSRRPASATWSISAA